MSSIWPRFLRVALLPGLCGAQAYAQNAPASVSVDANAGKHAINPDIYGFAFGAQSDLAATNFTMNRSGGNGTSTYNWQINAANHASDYFFESILDPPQTPGYDGDAFIKQTRAGNASAQPLLTIPMIGYLAKLGSGGAKLWSFSIAKYGSQTASDPYQPDAGNGISSASSKPITGNDPLDANTPNSVSIQRAWVQHLVSTWGLAASGGLKYYILDNEPSLWSSTHRDIHPALETYSEIFNDFVNYAGAVRALEPNAIIVGPEEWSWWALFVSGLDQQNGINATGSDYTTHNNTYYYPWLLQQLAAYHQSTGKQLLNVLSVHYYPMELANSNDDSLSAQLIRNQSTRALWDPTYVDPSWFNQVGINGGIVNLIPTLKGWVNQYYPGLQTAVTEYNWGDETNLNGATSQADVLGIFGREGLDLATRWTVPANPSPTYLALEIYRNYDGKLSTFGDTSVSASVTNPDNLSSFAALRSSDGALTVMVINKQQGSTPVNISLANFGTTGSAQAYQIASAKQAAVTQVGNIPVANNVITTTVPSQSITLFVIPAGSITSVPTAPTSLAATVGSGTVTLTWNPGGGATSYTVKRAAVSGGPYLSLGAVTDTKATYTDTGLTNGVNYYYVVSGSNAAGSSPNSAELAVAPIVPPTFSSSASASPNALTQGASATVQATVTCTSNSLTNGIVQILVFDPNGNTVATQNSIGQNFAPQQSQKYGLTLTAALAGTYTVEVGVFSSTWQLWNWNASAAGFTANSSLVFKSSAMSPSTVAASGTAPISVTITETGPAALANGNVELQVFNSAGSAVATQVWTAQNFAAGQSMTYSYNWTPVGTLAPGSYSVDVGVFDSGWSHNYYWNTDATIVVTGTASSILLSPTALTFASHTLDMTSRAQSVILANSGTEPVNITSIAVTGANPGDFAQTNNCGSTLAAGARCGFSVTFKPTVAGYRSAAISITDSAAGSPQSVILSGTGVVHAH
jgi:Glycoside hydrolase family 44